MDSNNVIVEGSVRKGYIVPSQCTMDVNIDTGKKEGKAVVKDNYGKLVAELVYEDDMLNGVCYFYEMGIKKERRNYKNDFMDGLCIEYRGGQPYKQYKYSRGVKKSYLKKSDKKEGFLEEVEYHSNNTLSICRYDSDFKRQGVGYIYENNQIEKVVEFKDNDETFILKSFENNKMKEYDGNGNPKYYGGFKDDLQSDYPRHGSGIESDNGSCLYDGDWKENIRCGNGSSFKEGRAYYTGEWKNNLPDGEGTLYDTMGNVRYNGEWEGGQYEIEPSKYYDYSTDTIVIIPRRRSPVSFTIQTDNEVHQVLTDDQWKMKLEKLTIDENVGNRIVEELEISGFYKLESIVIKKNCLKNLLSLKISNNPLLKTFTTEDGDGGYYPMELNTGACYSVYKVCFENLPELTSITIGAYSFCDTYKEFLLNNLPKLETLRIGSDAFRELKYMNITDLPSLKEIIMDRYSFNNTTGLTLKNLPNLVNFHTGSNSFYYGSVLIIYNTPKLKIIYINNDSFHRLKSANIDNLPELEELFIGYNALFETKEMKLHNLPKLKKFSTGRFSVYNTGRLTITKTPFKDGQYTHGGYNSFSPFHLLYKNNLVNTNHDEESINLFNQIKNCRQSIKRVT